MRGVISTAPRWAVWLPAIALVGWMLLASSLFPSSMIDLQRAFLPAARAVLHGHSPYHAAHARFDAGRSAYVYPPPVAFLAIPLGMLSAPLAGVIFTASTIVAAGGSLWLLGVRDSRCYAIVLAAHPVVMGELVGAISGLVLLGLAAAWRWRDARSMAGCAIGITLSAKVFCWPVVVWLLVTRRFAAGIGSVWIAATVVIATWAAIGFAGVRGYLRLLAYVTSHEAADSYSPAGLLHGAGVPLPLAEGTAVAGALLLIATVVVWRSRDAIVFVAATAAALVASPVVWDHYFALLVIPCALAWPRFSAAWVLLLGGWILVATNQDSPSLAGAIAYDLLAAAVFALSVRAMSLKESRGGEGLQSSPPRFDSDPRRRVER